jgi:exonuclease VII large subunit
MKANIRSKTAEAASAVDKAVIILRENDPRRVFAKGYAAVTDKNGKIIPEAAGIRTGEEYDIIMSDGSFSAKVTGVDLN